MADLTLSQPERRNFTVPVVLALVLLGIAGFFLFRFTPHSTADLTITRVDLYPAHTVFKSDSNVVGEDPAQDDLYAFVTVRLTDRLRLPLFLKDITATLIPGDGSLQPATSAIEHAQLENLYTSFPAVRRLAAAQTAPLLLRESRINPGETVEGYVILHFPVDAKVWNSRNDAVLTLDLYHQQSSPSLSQNPPWPRFLHPSKPLQRFTPGKDHPKARITPGEAKHRGGEAQAERQLRQSQFAVISTEQREWRDPRIPQRANSSRAHAPRRQPEPQRTRLN